jgi:hypothetical protein
MQALVGQDPLRIAEPGELGVDLRSGADDDPEALLLAEGEECVDVVGRVDLAEVEAALLDLVDGAPVEGHLVPVDGEGPVLDRHGAVGAGSVWHVCSFLSW